MGVLQEVGLCLLMETYRGFAGSGIVFALNKYEDFAGSGIVFDNGEVLQEWIVFANGGGFAGSGIVFANGEEGLCLLMEMYGGLQEVGLCLLMEKYGDFAGSGIVFANGEVWGFAGSGIVFANGEEVGLCFYGDVWGFAGSGIVFANGELWGFAGSGIVFANGDDWKGRRRFSLQAMRDFGVGKSSLEEKILEEIQNVADDLEKMKGAEISNLKEMMTKASCNVIHSLIFGYRYKHDNESLQQLIKTMDNIFSGPGALSASGIFPVLNLIMKDNLKMRRDGFSTLKKYIEKHITEHRESFDPEHIRDFIDMYVEAEKEESERTSALNPAALLASIMDLFAAGTDTTSTTLDWSFKWMIQYPDIQKRCQEEITKASIMF
ncbi:unnamed protein product [Mytilus edulis]|uniref:Cytochrome P450 n=1 Tax=Mytilus edulis TaxID=6550 RepID=A0A8S3QIN4_MYTED|nr:unnamed protein product [Mytilus edulis]